MKIRRFILAASPMGLVVMALIFSAIQLMSRANGSEQAAPGIVWIAVTIVLVFWMVQTYSGYLQKLYDPKWVLKFDDDWMNSVNQRRAAAKALADYQGHLSEVDEHRSDLEPIDEVLDFFETVGFYMSGEQMSAEVIHHHLFHWLRGYWCASRTYVEAWQRKETLRWEHIAALYDTTAQIEAKREGIRKEKVLFDEQKVKEFIEEELRLPG